jgi:glycine hydroxymethyltransferase
MAAVLTKRGLRIVSGGTDSHLFLVDLQTEEGSTGKDAEAALGAPAHYGQQERDPERPGEADGDRAACASARRR